MIAIDKIKTLYLMRHGETLFNKQSKIQGFCDSPLTNLGVHQAKVAKEHIEDQKITFDVAYSSTSERAIDTLKIITDQKFKTIKDLREWNFGSLEGEGEHLNPPLPYKDFFVQFGGEDEKDFKRRIYETISTLVESSVGENILMVSHGAAIAQFYLHWEHLSDVRRNIYERIQNCSIFKYRFEDNKFYLEDIIEHDFQ